MTVELGARGGETLPQLVLTVFFGGAGRDAAGSSTLPAQVTGSGRLARLRLGGILGDDRLGALNDGRAVREALALAALRSSRGPCVPQRPSRRPRRDAA